jgi:hypothetical protein
MSTRSGEFVVALGLLSYKRDRDLTENPFKTYDLKKLVRAKIAVLSTDLASAMPVATVDAANPYQAS